MTTGVSCPGGSPDCRGVMHHDAECCPPCAAYLEAGKPGARRILQRILAWTHKPDREAGT
jgi:hypothetical protein